MGYFFGRLGPEKKYFSTFFWGPPSGVPILDPFWTKIWVKASTVSSLWVTIEAYLGLKWLLGASNESENVRKSAQNGSKMASKWPHRAIWGPFWAFFGRFQAIWGS